MDGREHFINYVITDESKNKKRFRFFALRFQPGLVGMKSSFLQIKRYVKSCFQYKISNF